MQREDSQKVIARKGEHPFIASWYWLGYLIRSLTFGSGLRLSHYYTEASLHFSTLSVSPLLLHLRTSTPEGKTPSLWSPTHGKLSQPDPTSCTCKSASTPRRT